MHMSIAKRLTLAFGTVLFFFFSFAAVTAYEISEISKASARLLKTNSLTQKLGALEKEIRQNSVRSIAIGFSDGSTVLGLFQKDLTNSAQRINEHLAAITAEGISVELAPEFKAHQTLIDGWGNLQKEMLKLRSEGDVGAAREMLQSQFLEVVNQLNLKSQRLIEMQAEEARQAHDSLNQGFKRLYLSGGIILLFGLLVSLFTSVRVAKYVVRGLLQVKHCVSRIGTGDLTSTVVFSGHDEVAEILKEVGLMQEKLVEIVTTVQTGAGHVALASAEIAQGNLSLSNRTESQAATVEEATSSIEDLKVTVSSNVKSSVEATALAKQANQQAEIGRAIANQMVKTMASIDESSKKISDITGLIDSIAFQTNILALNAAVEAARAGENGRGFAVVASEVRSLAGKSADAAKGIRVLIDDSTSRVNSGNAQIAKVGEAVQLISQSIGSLDALISEIHAGGASQSRDVNQVWDSIKFMETFTQENAALVEEMASAAASTGKQAADLLQVANVFRLSRSALAA